MRKQYHFRPSPNGYYAWDVGRLVKLSANFESQLVRLTDIKEVDEAYWFAGADKAVTCRQIAQHARQIEEADLAHPIIMCSSRRIMDGMHRVLKALNLGIHTIDAKIFEIDPEPDYIDVYPDELPY